MSQWLLSIIFIVCGYVAGMLHSVFCGVKLYTKSKTLINIIIDFVVVFAIGLMFIVILNIFYYGQLRFYLLISYILGIYLEKITLGKVIAKSSLILYNTIAKMIKAVAKFKIIRRIVK